MGFSGREIHGVLRSADASGAGGVVVPIYDAGTDGTAITLGTSQFIEITDIGSILTPGGDLHVFFGTGAPAAGSTIIRGDVVANGGIVKSFVRTGRHGDAGDAVRVQAPIGNVDVWFTGRLSEA